jgi:sugar phosphate isomerase/epimerase
MDNRKIKIGCGEWGFRDLPMSRHFEIASDFGFRSLEFGIGGGQTGRLPSETTKQHVIRFLEISKRHGIATPVCCLENDFTLPDQQAHTQMVSMTKTQMHAAAECGARKIRLFAGFTPVEEMSEAIWHQMITAFHELEPISQELGLSITIETHGRIAFDNGAAHHAHTVSTSPAAIARMKRELPLRIGFNYDPGNLKAVNPADPDCLLPLLNDRITYCHLKDWKKHGNGWLACAIGDDDLAYPRLLPEMTYDGLCMIEYEPTHDIEDGIRRSLDYLRRINMEIEFA